ncbi:hypothetical protein DOTSEDRAFT_77318 [Dothistroma septosporum NZE10]|uniref:Uncharacterized protein n=1 Tax=Dothistroma septosporum (strain NZE10 / CBS 128990) TaxID=675120 RepID=N1Q4I4_DOTSN|nr:hypothetical protein DOTSEDRAFT_77318 [Dothistroma septosporum NZE10]
MALNNTQSAAGSNTRAELEQMIRDGLDDIGNGYNSLEDRVHNTEVRTHSLFPRLNTLEAHMRSQDQHQMQTHDAIAQLSTAKELIKTLQTDTGDRNAKITRLSKSINDVNDRSKDSQAETNATLEKLMKRVKVLESKNQDSPDDDRTSPFTSAEDLADALLVRLQGGEQLTPETIGQLKAAMGSSGPLSAGHVASSARTRLPDAPSTDKEPAAQTQKPAAKRRRTAEDDAPTRSAKRVKDTIEKTVVKPPSSAPVKKSLSIPPYQQRSSPRGKKEPHASAPTSAASSFATDEQLDSSQPRRTTRGAKPTKRANYMTWLEVKAARSSSSSQK